MWTHWGKAREGEKDRHVYTMVCKTDGARWPALGAQRGTLLWPRGVGWGEGGDVCTHIVDSLRCTEQTNTILQTKHTPIKMK